MKETARRELFVLVGSVLLVDLLFMAGFFLGNVRSSSSPAKLGFTVLWTLVTLAVVLRGLIRLRRARVRSPASEHCAPRSFRSAMNDQSDVGRPWGLVHGATVMPDGQVRFSVWAPKAKEVTVSVS